MDSIGKRLFRELRDDEGKIGVHSIFLAQQKTHTRAGSTSSSWAHAAFCRLPGQKLPFSYCYLAITFSTNSFLLGFLKGRFAKKLPSSILQELLAKDHGLIVARNHLIDFRHSSGSVGQQLQSSIFRWHVHSIKLKRHSQSVDMPLQLDVIATGKQQLQTVEPWDEMLQEAWVKEGIFPTWLSNNVSMPGRIPARSRAGSKETCQFLSLPFGWNKSKSAKVLADICFGEVSQNIRMQTASACHEVLQNQQVLLSFLSCLYFIRPYMSLVHGCTITVSRTCPNFKRMISVTSAWGLPL